jgi:hypothetical protein
MTAHCLTKVSLVPTQPQHLPTISLAMQNQIMHLHLSIMMTNRHLTNRHLSNPRIPKHRKSTLSKNQNMKIYMMTNMMKNTKKTRTMTTWTPIWTPHFCHHQSDLLHFFSTTRETQMQNQRSHQCCTRKVHGKLHKSRWI